MTEHTHQALWQRLLTLEPALVRSVAAVLVLIASNVGLNIADAADRTVTVVLAVLALLPVIQAWWTRGAVTPSATVVQTVEPNGTVVAGPASPLPTGTVIKSPVHILPLDA